MNGKWSIVSVIVCGSTALFASGARADAELDACGGMFLSADAHCEYRPKKECMTECSTKTVETSCVSKVYHECESQCTVKASVDCESMCTKSCSTDCTEDDHIDCQATCESECAKDCDSRCDGDGDHCGGCCSHNCSAHCEAECKETKETKCEPKCTTACSGSCSAEANIDCQLECQDKTYTSCEKEMVTTCQTSCENKGGAIFCDGQFINAGSLKSCVDELASKIDIHIDISAVTDVCSGDNCDTSNVKKETKKTLSCSVERVGSNGRKGALAGALFGVATLCFARKRRNRR